MNNDAIVVRKRNSHLYYVDRTDLKKSDNTGMIHDKLDKELLENIEIRRKPTQGPDLHNKLSLSPHNLKERSDDEYNWWSYKEGTIHHCLSHHISPFRFENHHHVLNQQINHFEPPLQSDN